jgi:hypothetical protein
MTEQERLAAALAYQQAQPALMNPNLARQGARGRENMMPPTSVMDERYPAWKRNQEDAEKLMLGLDIVGSAIPLAGPAAKGAVAVGKYAAPQIAQGLENYAFRTGMALPMDVWHGTPHRFPPTAKNPLGEFDPTKIGTGEGAQAYGYGHYVAEQPAVAKDYKFMERNWFDTDKATYQGKPIQYWYDKAQRDQNLAFRTKNAALEKDANARLAYWESVMTHEHPESVLKKMSDQEFGWPEATKYAKSVQLNKFQGIPEPGSLYKVDLPDEAVARMLDWDKPLSQQHPDVQAALNKLGIAIDKTKLNEFDDALLQALQSNETTTLPKQPINPLGADIYSKFVGGGNVAAAQKLREIGIPGIKYLDQFSRDKGTGTRNFVVFPGNEGLLNILGRE